MYNRANYYKLLLLSLIFMEEIPVPMLVKFCDDYRFLFALSNVFIWHSRIFCVRETMKTVLKDVYKDDQLIDQEPLSGMGKRC